MNSETALAPIAGKLEIAGTHDGLINIRSVEVEAGEFGAARAIPVCNAFRKENAQRLVDCWNACIGLNPAAVPELVEALLAISATSVPQSTATKEVWIAAGQRWIAAIEKARAALAQAKEV